jgi:hypothetical protein
VRSSSAISTNSPCCSRGCRKLPIPALDDTAVVAAFTAAHSQAEVFREEAIELVLGKVETMKPETLAELLQTMRGRLATQWRRTQRAAAGKDAAQRRADRCRGAARLRTCSAA